MITNSTGSLNNVASLSTSFHSTSITNKSSIDPASNVNISTQKTQSDITNASKPDQLQKAVDKIEKFAQAASQNLKFSIDEDSGKTVIKVMDATTDEVVRQIPSEEAIDIAHSLSKIHGALFNDHA